MDHRNVVVLVGGVGGAKLAVGLAGTVAPENLTVIVNTADDFWHYGLRISPDLDTITYTLSGLVDKVNGWGVQDDTTITMDALHRYGEEPWFRLGDQDLATHLIRTGALRAGDTLTSVTRRITRALGIECSILPMSDDPVATIVDTVEHGEMEFQEYFVKHRWQPTVLNLRLDGIKQAAITPQVQHALEAADLVVIGPSNPWLSINPILSVPGMREAIIARAVPRIAVTPMIEGQAVKGPTVKIMRELGYTVSIETIIDFYAEVINGFVIDVRDQSSQPDHLHTLAYDTLMTNQAKKIALANALLTWTSDWTIRL